MNKEWFLFKGTHHQGPFSVEEIAAFFSAGEINGHVLLWKEGNEQWVPLTEILEFTFLFKPQEIPVPQEIVKPQEILVTPPTLSLPSLPPIPSVPLSPPPLPSIADTNMEDLPPPIPLEAIIDPKGQMRHKVKNKEKKLLYSKYLFIFGMISLIAIIAWYGVTQKQAAIQLKIKGIMPVYLDKLEITALKHSPRFETEMALSLDGIVLWGSTNFDGEIETIVKMISVPKRLLGLIHNEGVVVTVKGHFLHHVAKFDKMVLLQGTKFLQGEYHYHVEGRETHFINRYFKNLSDIPFFKSLNKTYIYDGTALIYPGTPKEFEKHLLDYNGTLLDNKLRPFQDHLESFHTFESLLNSTSQNYLMALENIKKGKDIVSFENKFIQEISPLLESLVTKALESTTGLKDVNAEFNAEQVKIGKQIGEMVSDMNTDTQKIKKLMDADKSGLRKKFDTRAQGIKLQIDIQLKKIDDQIHKITK